MNLKWIASSLLLLAMTSFSLAAWAGQPWKVNVIKKNGVPVRWPYNDVTKKWVLEWYVDPGPLVDGPTLHIDSVTAVKEWITPMLNDWEGVTLFYNKSTAVPTTNLEIVYRGPMTGVGSDIDKTDYTTFTTERDDFAYPTKPVVIFDPDGEIIKKICLSDPENTEELCECIRGGVDTNDLGESICGGAIAGLANPFPNSEYEKFVSGYIILNGRLIDGVGDNENQEMDPGDDENYRGFRAVIKHEFGHLLNLDHSQVNYDMADQKCGRDDLGEEVCSDPQALGTMFPAMKNQAQYSLHRDDIVALSFIYPSENFLTKFCMIKGTILDSAGKPMQGVNVLATNMAEPSIDVRSFVSGVLYPPTNENGDYVLAGIVPGQSYEVTYEPLDPNDNYNSIEGSEFGPLGKESPTGFEPGTVLGPGNSATVSCKEGGEVIEMPAKKVFTDGDGGASTDSASASADTRYGKGWCQLQPGRSPNGSHLFFYFVPFLFLAVLVIWRRCKEKSI